jgi:hypothetical protein
MDTSIATVMILGSFVTVIGFMAKTALNKISRLEIDMHSKIDADKHTLSVGDVYKRTDQHFEQLRKDINGIGDKFEAKIDKLSDKLTSHIENTHTG